MNFSKRKIIFVALLQILLFSTFLWFSGGVERNDGDKISRQGVFNADTAHAETVQVVMAGEKNNEMNELDRGSPKTINMILYLIYEFTFKKMN